MRDGEEGSDEQKVVGFRAMQYIVVATLLPSFAPSPISPVGWLLDQGLRVGG